MGACMGFGSLFSKEAREFWINLDFIKVFPNKKISSISLKDFMWVIPLWFEMITASMLKKQVRWMIYEKEDIFQTTRFPKG